MSNFQDYNTFFSLLNNFTKSRRTRWASPLGYILRAWMILSKESLLIPSFVKWILSSWFTEIIFLLLQHLSHVHLAHLWQTSILRTLASMIQHTSFESLRLVNTFILLSWQSYIFLSTFLEKVGNLFLSVTRVSSISD